MAVDKKWAWILATVPFSAGVLFGVIVGFHGYSGAWSMIVVVILSLSFAYLDIMALKAQKKSLKAWAWLGAVFAADIYLLIRAYNTDKDYKYAIVWSAMRILYLFALLLLLKPSQ